MTTVTGEIWPHSLSFPNCSIPKDTGQLGGSAKDTQAPSPGIPGDLARAGNQWLIHYCPHHRTEVLDLVPVRRCVV